MDPLHEQPQLGLLVPQPLTLGVGNILWRAAVHHSFTNGSAETAFTPNTPGPPTPDLWLLPGSLKGISAPRATMQPQGYVIMQPEMRLDRPVKAYERWLQRIPWVYSSAVLGESPPSREDDSHRIATMRNYRSLMPLAHDARKPMFDLKPANGALGSTQQYVKTC
ncbi:hypothetical protein ABZ235_39220 [Streptomyces canus]|uniref:hypothetical protein n=1 Tax=Streptomyces canus TaxID=58343 RepID=UPI0033B35DBA